VAGTKPYMAPEVLSPSASVSGYSFPVDWWSLGITAFEMKTGSRPFENATAARTTSDVVNLFPDRWSPEFAKFITGFVEVASDKRISSMKGKLNKKCV
jgi:serine/threonine kinase 32